MGNDGFTDKPQNGSTIHGTSLFQIGGGYGISVQMVHLMAMLYKPLNDGGSEISYGFGVQFGAGVNFDLWTPHGADGAARD